MVSRFSPLILVCVFFFLGCNNSLEEQRKKSIELQIKATEMMIALEYRNKVSVNEILSLLDESISLDKNNTYSYATKFQVQIMSGDYDGGINTLDEIVFSDISNESLDFFYCMTKERIEKLHTEKDDFKSCYRKVVEHYDLDKKDILNANRLFILMMAEHEKVDHYKSLYFSGSPKNESIAPSMAPLTDETVKNFNRDKFLENFFEEYPTLAKEEQAKREVPVN